MNKKIYYWSLLLLGITCSFVACVDHNDDNVDEEWKQFNATAFSKVLTDDSFKKLNSQTNNGSVCWKLSTDIADSDKSTRITSQGRPEFTDTVVVRYEGWYFDKDGKKYIFDSTENPSLLTISLYNQGKLLDPNPNKVKRKTAISPIQLSTLTVNLDGLTTLLQNMKVGEERLVCIPQELGYGNSRQTYIPAYTTLWFRIKLFEIIPMKGTN